MPHVGHLRDCPLGGRLVIRRAGDARAVAIGEHVQGVHDLRMLHFFAAEFRGISLVHFVLRHQETGNGGGKQQLFHIGPGYLIGG